MAAKQQEESSSRELHSNPSVEGLTDHDWDAILRLSQTCVFCNPSLTGKLQERTEELTTVYIEKMTIIREKLEKFIRNVENALSQGRISWTQDRIREILMDGNQNQRAGGSTKSGDEDQSFENSWELGRDVNLANGLEYLRGILSQQDPNILEDFRSAWLSEKAELNNRVERIVQDIEGLAFEKLRQWKFEEANLFKQAFGAWMTILRKLKIEHRPTVSPRSMQAHMLSLLHFWEVSSWQNFQEELQDAKDADRLNNLMCSLQSPTQSSAALQKVGRIPGLREHIHKAFHGKMQDKSGGSKSSFRMKKRRGRKKSRSRRKVTKKRRSPRRKRKSRRRRKKSRNLKKHKFKFWPYSQETPVTLWKKLTSRERKLIRNQLLNQPLTIEETTQFLLYVVDNLFPDMSAINKSLIIRDYLDESVDLNNLMANRLVNPSDDLFDRMNEYYCDYRNWEHRDATTNMGYLIHKEVWIDPFPNRPWTDCTRHEEVKDRPYATERR